MPTEEKEETIPVKWEVSDNIGNAGTRLVISHPQVCHEYSLVTLIDS